MSQIIVMERGRVSIQGSLARIQSERPDLHQAWQQAMAVTPDSCQPGQPGEPCQLGQPAPFNARGERTARERWQLVRLVSRIGLQQRSDPRSDPRTEEKVPSLAPRHFRVSYNVRKYFNGF